MFPSKLIIHMESCVTERRKVSCGTGADARMRVIALDAKGVKPAKWTENILSLPAHPVFQVSFFLGDATSSLGDAYISLGDVKSSLGDATSSLGDAKSSPGDAKSSLGDATSSLGDAKSSPGDA